MIMIVRMGRLVREHSFSECTGSHPGGRRFAQEFLMSFQPESHYLRIYGSSPAYQMFDLVKLLPSLSHKQRKCLLTVTRARCYPVRGTSLHSQTWDYLLPIVRNPLYQRQLIEVLSSPMRSGFFLSAIMSAPYSEAEVRNIKHELLWKEVSVMESCPRDPSVDWENLYTIDEPLHQDLKLAPKLNNIVRRAIYRWSLKCERTILYPAFSSKGVSFQTRDNFETYYGPIDRDCELTTGMLEHYYSRTGVKVEGNCELKQRWYPTQASPRTYFAQGGSAYHTSKHLRDAFNWLCDSLRSTNRFDRVSVSGFAVDSLGDMYIYDLTSFTSLYHEHRSFLGFLSRAVEDVWVVVFDSWEGPIRRTLGSLIVDYLTHNVCQPSWSTKIPSFVDLELVHSVAGFLGVYGNLATCTFPHGLTLGTIRNSEQESYCAGDDAGTISEKERSRDVEMCAKVSGSISWEKTFVASEDGAIALKRPIGIYGGVTYQRPNILWPVFSVMCEADPRFTSIDTHDGLGRVCGAIMSFLQSCQRVPLTPSDIEFAYLFFEHFYERFHLPMSGWYPPLTGHYPWRVSIPRLERGVFGEDPLQLLVNSFFGTQYVCGLEDDIEWEGDSTLYLGNTFACNSHKHLTYLVKLGYLARTSVQEVVLGTEGLNRALKDIDPNRTNRHIVYEFTVVEPIPNHLMSLSQ
jgi:hypothetical protein